MFADIAA